MKTMLTWFAENHVAANLLMATILFAGIVTSMTIVQEVFPDTSLDIVTIQVMFLGATPGEVEEGVSVKIEEQIQSVDGIKKVTSTASEGAGLVRVELNRGVDPQKAYNDIKAEVDRIVTFPEETEKPVVTLMESRRPVMDVVVFGTADERSLKVLADKIRDDLVALRDISYAEVKGTRPFEISIEVSEAKLRAHGLSLSQVTAAVRANSLDLPGGSVKTDGGEILVRTKGQRYSGEEFARIVVITRPDGTRVTLDQIATVIDAFEDIDVVTRMDGRPAAMISVYRTGDENVLDVAEAVKGYVAEQRQTLPEGLEMVTWQDRAKIYRDRMNLLVRNGIMGLILVFFCLAIFLQMRLAFWVALGIAISFLGAFWLLPKFGVTLNMMSLFAFIVSLGIVVDDAIVVGENIFARREMGESPQQAATRGVIEVAGPVVFAVATTVVAFAPLYAVEGFMGKFMAPIAVVVISVLLFSLVESLLILPAHVATIKDVRAKGDQSAPGKAESRGLAGWYHRNKHVISGRLEAFVEGPYTRWLGRSLDNRRFVVAIAVGVLLVTLGFAAGGHIKFVFMPNIESDTITCDLTLPQGATLDDALIAAAHIEDALDRVAEEMSADLPATLPPLVQNVSTNIGSQPRGSGESTPMGGVSTGRGAHLVEINVQLLPGENRPVSAGEIARRWREATGSIPEAVALTFSADLFQGGKPISVQLSSPVTGDLVTASQALKAELSGFPGVIDISDSFREGKLEMKLNLEPEARTLGLTLSDLARQVRQGFYGDEVMRIQRGRDEVKVMVRYPVDERTSLGHIESMRVRTPSGAEIPFGRVATVEISRGYSSIERADRQRVVTVYADVEQAVTNAGEVLAELEAGFLPELLGRYPGLRYSLEGQERDRMESMQSLGRGFLLAIFMIYSLLAVLFRSYTQPLLVMSAIPFGIVGAVWGHVLMGWSLTLLSMFGVVALTGVVVNDSLLMIDFINRARRAGRPLREAIILSGTRRFRPILLTSVTTFLGLTPLLLERSLQAQFLIPMAISLGFGVLFATGITLFLVPVGYSVLVTVKRKLGLRDESGDGSTDSWAESLPPAEGSEVPVPPAL